MKGNRKHQQRHYTQSPTRWQQKSLYAQKYEVAHQVSDISVNEICPRLCVCVSAHVGGCCQCTHSAAAPTSGNLVTRNKSRYYHCCTLFSRATHTQTHTRGHTHIAATMTTCRDTAPQRHLVLDNTTNLRCFSHPIKAKNHDTELLCLADMIDDWFAALPGSRSSGRTGSLPPCRWRSRSPECRQRQCSWPCRSQCRCGRRWHPWQRRRLRKQSVDGGVEIRGEHNSNATTVFFFTRSPSCFPWSVVVLPAENATNT